MVQGFPFRIRGVNSENLKRCGFADEDIRAIKKAFRMLFNGSGGESINADALAELLACDDTNGHVKLFAEAVRRELESQEPDDD
jgi:acyl-[acyl carrier protein]--UDP-N-acetylglucosamine O-acyltransferase